MQAGENEISVAANDAGKLSIGDAAEKAHRHAEALGCRLQFCLLVAGANQVQCEIRLGAGVEQREQVLLRCEAAHIKGGRVEIIVRLLIEDGYVDIGGYE